MQHLVTYQNSHQSLEDFILEIARSKKELAGFRKEKPHLLLGNNKEWVLSSKEVTTLRMYVLCLEEHMSLTSQLEAFTINNDGRVERVLKFLNQENIQDFVVGHMYDIASTQLIVHKKSGHIVMDQLLKQIKPILVSVINYGWHMSFILEKDIQLFTEKIEGFQFWRDVLVGSVDSQYNCNNYRPWLEVLKISLTEIERQHVDVLSDAEFHVRCLSALIDWFNHPSKREIIVWVVNFLFKEEYIETKRKFLYVKGRPNTGKTFFIELLLHSTLFLRKYLSMSHFAAEKKGQYKLHAIIFDDPGKVSSNHNSQHSLAAEFFLNASKYGGDSGIMNFPTKYGFMSVKTGQLIFISNHEVKQIFPKEVLNAIQTRMLQADFDSGPQFPLVCTTTASNPFNFVMISPKEIDEIKAIFLENHVEEERVIEEDERGQIFEMQIEKADEDFFFDGNFFEEIQRLEYYTDPFQSITDERLNHDIIYYLLWEAILFIIQSNFEKQTNITQKLIVPSDRLREKITQLRAANGELIGTILDLIKTEDLCELI